MGGVGGGRFSKCNTFLNGMCLRPNTFLRALLQVRPNIPLRGYSRKFFFCVCALFFVFLCVCALVFRCLFVSLFVSLFVCLFVCSLFLCFFVCLFACLFVQQ